MAKSKKPAIEATFLTDQQIWGDDRGNGQLQVMKSYGTKTGMSDLAIALGGAIWGGYKTSDNQRSGYVWSASPHGDGRVRYVRGGGDRDGCGSYERLLAARPVLIMSSDASAEAFAKGEARLTKKISGVDIVEFGEYPQTIASESINRELEQALNARKLKETGKKYTFDAKKHNAYNNRFKAKEYAEYEHRGKRYIRVEAKPCDSDSILSTGRKPQAGEACWIKVQPIEWLVEPDKIKDYFGKPEGVLVDNPNAGMLVARQALFAGVQFDRNQSYDGSFAKTDMKQYLDRHFAKEMQVSREVGKPAALGAHTAALQLEERQTERGGCWG